MLSRSHCTCSAVTLMWCAAACTLTYQSASCRWDRWVRGRGATCPESRTALLTTGHHSFSVVYRLESVCLISSLGQPSPLKSAWLHPGLLLLLAPPTNEAVPTTTRTTRPAATRSSSLTLHLEEDWQEDPASCANRKTGAGTTTSLRRDCHQTAATACFHSLVSGNSAGVGVQMLKPLVSWKSAGTNRWTTEALRPAFPSSSFLSRPAHIPHK